MNIRDIANSRGQTILMIDPRVINVMPSLNARVMQSEDTQKHIEELAVSIKAQGFLGSHPLEVFSENDKIYVAAGHCRLAACMLAISRGLKLQAIPCLTEARGTSPAQRLLNQITSNSGARLNLIEEGRIYFRLTKMGLSLEQIAKDAGRSYSHIYQALNFQEAPAEVHALVASGKVSATLAAATVQKEGLQAITTLTKAVAKAEGEGRKKATAKHVNTPVSKNDAMAFVQRLAEVSFPFDSARACELLAEFIEQAQEIIGKNEKAA